ncbi:MAG: hypothetical protein WEF86_17205 [Gemmatimonadota bacterium]
MRSTESRMSNVRVAAMAALLAVMPASLTAQTAGATGSATAASQARTPEARIEAAVQAAARANVPASLVRSKVAEGRAKNVPEERIASAVEARVSALVRASDAFRRADLEFATAGELAVAADALDAGVSESALIGIYRTAPDERRVVAVAVLADMIRLGHESEPAFARVNAALASSTALAGLHAEIASQLRLGGLNSTLDAAGIIRLP